MGGSKFGRYIPIWPKISTFGGGTSHTTGPISLAFWIFCFVIQINRYIYQIKKIEMVGLNISGFWVHLTWYDAFCMLVVLKQTLLQTFRFNNLAQYFMKRYPELNIEVEKELIRYRVRNVFLHLSPLYNVSHCPSYNNNLQQFVMKY